METKKVKTNAGNYREFGIGQYLSLKNNNLIKEINGEEIFIAEDEEFHKERNDKIKLAKAREELVDTYENILTFLGEWVDIPEATKKIIAVWVIGTYLHKEFSTYPFLFFNAMRGSGKTRTLKIISHLQQNGNGDVLTNPSDSVIFRTAKERGLIIDEFESQKSKDKQALREILNSAYKKGGKVFRSEKEKKDGKEVYTPKAHDVFTPVAMANINGIEDVLGDRSISLILDKSMNPALVKKIEDFETNIILYQLKESLKRTLCIVCSVYPLQKAIYNWNKYVSFKYTYIHTSNMYTKTLHIEKEEIPEEMMEFFNKIDGTGIFGRNLELFFPLLLTAQSIDGSVFDEIVEIVKDLNNVKKEDDFVESKDIALIEFVSLAERYRFEYQFVHELHKEFRDFVGNIGDDEKDKWNTITWFGLALKRLKLLSDRKRVAKGYLVLLAIDKAKEKMLMFKKEDTQDEKVSNHT